jgi:hypothetical protein
VAFASSLKAHALQTHDAAEMLRAVRALFAMDEEAALPVWEAFCDTGRASVALPDLERLSTPTTAALLARIAASPAQGVRARNAALAKLGRMNASAWPKMHNRELEVVTAGLLAQLRGTVPPLEPAEGG